MKPGLIALATSCLLFGGAVPAPTQQRPPPRVTVFVAQDAAPFRDAIAGLRATLGSAAELTIINLYTNPGRVAAELRASQATQPAVIVTLGSVVTQAAIDAGGTTPIVASMLLNPAEIAGTDRATGVYLEFPVEVELEWIRRALPNATRIGVVYHSPASARRIHEAQHLAPRFNMTVRAFQVSRPEQIPDALAGISGQADVLWGMIDPLVYNPETAKSILLFSFRSTVPLVGPAPPWVRAGGFMALERDYHDIGAQTGELVRRILAGAHPRTISPVGPRTVRYLLNANTAEQIRISLPVGLTRGALEVIR